MINGLKSALQRQFNEMKSSTLFRTQIDKDTLWLTYLNSFPEGTDPIYKEKSQHDCNACRSFVKNIGNLVTISPNNELVSLWDVTTGDFYEEVAKKLSSLVKSYPIENIFLHPESTVGVDKNYGIVDGVSTTYEHMFIRLPNEVVNKEPGSKLGLSKSTKEVFFRGLQEISIPALEIVLDIIKQGSLYKGDEYKASLQKFLALKEQFDKLQNENVDSWARTQDCFLWKTSASTPEYITKIRNTSIGTLLLDITKDSSEGAIDRAVLAFETIVAPTNYKRPKPVVTKAQIEAARKQVEELGIAGALERRYAILEDIPVTDFLFVDNTNAKVNKDVFDVLSSTVSVSPKSLSKVEEVHIDKFISDILPSISSMEILLENSHAGNLVSLVAPADLTAKSIFKWPNAFSWSYAGDLTDSIKARVKAAGGKVDGALRVSLSWFNTDDLDLYITEPLGFKIFFGNKISPKTGGRLDVDMNVSTTVRDPVENIIYPSFDTIKEGNYDISVNQYNRRENKDLGFEVEVEFNGTAHILTYPDRVSGIVKVGTIHYTKASGFTLTSPLSSTQKSKTLWNLSTQNYHKVKLMLLSPNFWGESKVGNKHYMFMLDSCINPETARGFYNEFLSTEFDKHKRVFELVGSKMRTDEADKQLSGLGFSSTQRNSVTAKLSGKFNRTIKILF